MNIKKIDKTAEIAIIGLTNSGKSTFITQLIDKNSISNDYIESLSRCNDGGLTKVTTYYKICKNLENANIVVEDVTFRKDIEFKIGDKLHSDINQFLRKNGLDICNDRQELEDRMESLKQKMILNFSTTINIINSDNASKLILNIKIKARASNNIANIMSKYDFDEVVFRDTRGFLDEEKTELNTKEFTLKNVGLDNIHACIWMGGRNSAIPNLARQIYGDFIKSIFEAVPTFIIEQNGELRAYLKYINFEEEKNEDFSLYHKLVKDNSINDVNFEEFNKLLDSLKIREKDIPANILIKNNEKRFLLPQVNFKNEQNCYIYQYCLSAVFDELMNSVSSLRKRITEISEFLSKDYNKKIISEAIFNIFMKQYFNVILFNFFKQESGSCVRPMLTGFDFSSLSIKLISGDLLGMYDGITTRENNEYRYPATGVFSATMWKVLNNIFSSLDRSKEFEEAIMKCIDSEELLSIYKLKVQQCLQYVLQNQYTDVNANFGSWPIIDRFCAKDSILEMRELWKNEYSKEYGDNSINTVYLTNISKLVDEIIELYPYIKLGNDWYVRSSQWYKAFVNSINYYFKQISDQSLLIETDHISI